MRIGEISNRKEVSRGDKIFDIQINKDENVNRRYRITIASEGNTIGFCALKPARNNHTTGYRITNYSMYGAAGLGLGQEMISFFQEWSGKSVIPSGVFGATGQLTGRGHDAAKKRMQRELPDWLPDDWEEDFDNANIIS